MQSNLLDTNMWLALVFENHPLHRLSSKILNECTSKTKGLFCQLTEQAFLRLVTTQALHQAYSTPVITNQDAVKLFEKLIALPQVASLEENSKEIRKLSRRLAGVPSASPKLWTDAYLAAVAIHHKLTFVTADRGFIRWKNESLKLQMIHIPD